MQTTRSNPTPAGEWTPPETPNKPIDTSPTDPNDLGNRINDVDIVNKNGSESGTGYTDFDLKVGANTWMEGLDPEPEENGDPYFIVKINDTLVARTDEVPPRKQGSFDIPIKAGALKQFTAGTLQIRILLLDTDSSRDDKYGEWTGTIEYRPR